MLGAMTNQPASWRDMFLTMTHLALGVAQETLLQTLASYKTGFVPGCVPKRWPGTLQPSRGQGFEFVLDQQTLPELQMRSLLPAAPQGN